MTNGRAIPIAYRGVDAPAAAVISSAATALVAAGSGAIAPLAAGGPLVIDTDSSPVAAAVVATAAAVIATAPVVTTLSIVDGLLLLGWDISLSARVSSAQALLRPSPEGGRFKEASNSSPMAELLSPHCGPQDALLSTAG